MGGDVTEKLAALCQPPQALNEWPVGLGGPGRAELGLDSISAGTALPDASWAWRGHAAFLDVTGQSQQRPRHAVRAEGLSSPSRKGARDVSPPK